jgi:hypothetical protein
MTGLPLSRRLPTLFAGNHLAGIAQKSEAPLHIQETAWRGVAKLFAELEKYTGEPAPYTEGDVAEHFAAKEAERRAALAGATPMSHMANKEGAFQRRPPTEAVQLVSDPTQQAIAARRRLHQAQAAMHQYGVRSFAGKTADSMIPNVTASPAPYDLASNATVRTGRAYLSGRTE